MRIQNSETQWGKRRTVRLGWSHDIPTVQWGRYIGNTAATTITYYPIAFLHRVLALSVTAGNASSEDVTVTISSNQTMPANTFAWVAWKANAYDTFVGDASISYIAIGH